MITSFNTQLFDISMNSATVGSLNTSRQRATGTQY